MNSRRDTYRVGLTRFSLLHLVGRRTHSVYKIKDYNGKVLGGNFYAFELQRVIKEDDVYKTDKILKTHGNDKAKPNTWCIGKDTPPHSTAGELIS